MDWTDPPLGPAAASPSPPVRPARGLNRVPTVVGVGVLAGLLVVLAALVAFTGPEVAPARENASPGSPEPATPVLSVRRSLDALSQARADNELAATLAGFVATLPADSCLAVDAGGVSFRHRSDDPQAPASVLKLFTATAALVELGPDATFTTTVRAERVDGAVVNGDLHLVGGGDPLLSTAAYAARFPNQPQIFSDIAALADAIVASGIREVTGSVVGDESRYDSERYNPLWPNRFIVQDQIGPQSALTVNDGFSTFPESGTSGLDPTADPPAYAASVLTDLLRARGVAVVGPPRAGTAPAAALIELGTLTSPSVREIVTEMLQESDNATGELLLREMALTRSGAGTTAAGAAAVTEILTDAGLDTAQLTIVDGSGLAIEDQVTCDAVDALLDLPATAPALEAALSVVGVNGTLAKRWNGTSLVGAVRAKTGTLNQVAALAGYATTQIGDDAQFVLIVNTEAPAVLGAAALDHQRTLLETLVAYPALVDLSALVPVGG